MAEAEEDPRLHRDLLTFILGGAVGPASRLPERSLILSTRRFARSSAESTRIGASGPGQQAESAVGGISGGPFARGEGAARNSRRRDAVGTRCGEGREARRTRGRRTHREQDCGLDRGRQSIAGGQMMEYRGGPCGARGAPPRFRRRFRMPLVMRHEPEPVDAALQHGIQQPKHRVERARPERRPDQAAQQDRLLHNIESIAPYNNQTAVDTSL
jgi:hypothetical protein